MRNNFLRRYLKEDPVHLKVCLIKILWFSVQVLLAMRANVEDRGIKGDCTPLMEAASGGYVDIVKLLILHDADVNAQSSAGRTFPDNYKHFLIHICVSYVHFPTTCAFPDTYVYHSMSILDVITFIHKCELWVEKSFIST